MGPSGSGKTTFLNIAGLLDTFDEGDLRARRPRTSADLSDRRDVEGPQPVKIGFIFQSFNLMPDLNVFDNVDVPLRYRGMASARRRQGSDRARRSRWSACRRA